MDLSKYCVAVFDCDGVILDSNKVKSEAFSLALEGEPPELVSRFVEYHQLNGGISRYVKFEYFFKELKKQKDYHHDLEQALKRYGELSFQGLLKCSEVPHIRELLEYFRINNISCYVASGGAQDEVQEVLKLRELSQYFDEIYGSPKSKIENLAELKSIGKLTGPMIYFGDANSDLVAAKAFNMDFVFVNNASEWEAGYNVCREQNISIVDDYSKLLGTV
ncbi:HAD family hydrolase [Vibrio coralliilyticus]|uniref:HAD family hydrolase n=1 Tax=Vibrio coralliilyticus TaxID=190893 RepID=UPI0006968792|nr:HAD hydrolase-like protein [Vibrio coralliilyticus]QOU29783.1 HAD family hydrolase [Vibrio coralliilyticus]